MTDFPKTVASKSGEAREGHADQNKAAVGDTKPNGQHEDYWVLSEEDRKKGHVRPVRRSYVHGKALGGCGTKTTMSQAIAETYAKDPTFYGSTFCVVCRNHFPVAEFRWDNSEELVGS